MVKQNNFLSLMVIGDKPELLMKNFDVNKKVDKYIKYQFKDVSHIKENTLLVLSELLKQKNVNKKLIEEEINEISEMSDIEFYSSLTKDLECDEDGNAWSIENPNGKWVTYQGSSNYSTPLRIFNGQTVFQAKKRDVDWKSLHLFHSDVYSKVWDMVINDEKPNSFHDDVLYKNMKPHKQYILSFGTKENYVKYNTSYWCYAIIRGNVWEDANDKPIQEWVETFFDKYIKPLDDEELITIYEYIAIS
jgi:hypothetical protein